MPIAHDRLLQATLDLVRQSGTYVAGTWRDGSGHTIDVIDPSSGQVCGSVPTSSIADVDAAVGAARQAFEYGSEWRRMSHQDRSDLLRRLADVIESKSASFAELGTLEVGSPVNLSRSLHAAGPVAFFRFWSQAAIRGPMGGYEEALPMLDEPVMAASLIMREPIGVVAAIAAYNFPLLITSFKVGGALAAGCTAVLMPSPRTILSSIAFIACAEEAGLPPGVVNLVTGEADIGRHLTQAQGVDMITFTGSVEVGMSVMAQAAGGLKHTVLELGGKSPNILLPGTPVQTAVGPSILRYTRNAGQGCGATTRTFVPRASYAEYAAQAKDFISGIKVGSAWDETTDVGPVVRGDHRDRIEGYIDRALAAGATIEAGGGRPDLDGFYLNPTLIGNVENSAEICQEELFGPVGVLIPYDTVEEAIELANGTRYGLNANVWGPTDQAMHVARRLKAGTVTINGGGADRPDAPWASAGHSGVGVDRGMDGFSEFFHVRHIQYPLAQV
jgi:aldehyde dehydrogenase (NAD+)